jgi:hypothetical protein
MSLPLKAPLKLAATFLPSFIFPEAAKRMREKSV